MASESPLSARTSPDRKIGEEPQLELLEMLRSRHRLLGQTYEGALRAYGNEANPECLVHAAHSMRERFDALPVAAEIERKHTADLTEQVRKSSTAWSHVLDKTTSLTVAGWIGEIDAVLQKFLIQLTAFFKW